MLAAEASTALTLAELSAREIVSAVGADDAPLFARRALTAAARLPSARLGRALARFDRRAGDVGIARAAGEALARFGARLDVEGAVRRDGPVLVVTNHPGAYDALAAMTALGRDDVAFLAAERAFLRALPHVREHLVFADERSTRARAAAARSALARLDRGAALVHYGAGAIEPDGALAAEWSEGTGLLAAHAARGGAAVVPMFVCGVHSARARRLTVVRWAERRGVTTVAPLVQAVLPGFRDVVVRVRIGAPVHVDLAATHRERTRALRAAVASLMPA